MSLRDSQDLKLVAIDYDPVVLKIGEMALKKFRRRIKWLEADLGGGELVEQLAPFHRFDAAISSTALHWLYPSQLRSLYKNLAKVLRPRGVFVNCDPMPSGNDGRVLRDISKRLRQARSGDQHREWHGWTKWWNELQKDPYFEELFRIRRARYPDIHSHAVPLSFEFHEKTLREAGFREVGVVWQDLEQRILVGVR